MGKRIYCIVTVLLIGVLTMADCSKKEMNCWWDGALYSENSNQQLDVALKLLDQVTFCEDEHVLDIGCGDGKISNIIASKVPRGRVVGIDPSESMINFACKQFNSDCLQFLVAKASNFSFAESFDTIVSFSALHWETDQQQALDNMFSALRPGGRLVLAIPGPNPALNLALKEAINDEEWAPYFSNYQSKGMVWSSEEYTHLLEKAGFSNAKIQTVQRTYVFSSEKEYLDFMHAMVPHLACIPCGQRGLFAKSVFKRVQRKMELPLGDSSHTPFTVKVLEIFAEKPK